MNFEIPGPLVGAVRTTRRQMFADPRYRRYHEFKNRVRALANTAGVPAEIPAGQRIAIYMLVMWEKRARADLDNIIKAVLDALWKQDRAVWSINAVSGENTGKESAKIQVRITERGLSK